MAVSVHVPVKSHLRGGRLGLAVHQLQLFDEADDGGLGGEGVCGPNLQLGTSAAVATR